MRRLILIALVLAAAGCPMKKKHAPCDWMDDPVDPSPPAAFQEIGLPGTDATWCKPSKADTDPYLAKKRWVDMGDMGHHEELALWRDYLEKRGWKRVTPDGRNIENMRVMTSDKKPPKCGNVVENFVKDGKGVEIAVAFCPDHGVVDVEPADCTAKDAPNWCKGK